MKDDRLLTQLELKVMNILWNLKEAFVKEIIEHWPEKPLPAYNTVSTIVRILEEKGFVDHKAFGRSFQYFPLLSRSQYQKQLLRNIVTTAFSGSVTDLVSAIVADDQLSPEEIAELKQMIENSEKE